jgi:hypothetical protein
MELRYGGSRTEPADDKRDNDAAGQLLAGLPDLKDFGSAWANKAGAVTIPALARGELGLPVLAHWHVLGSPTLGVAILIGPRRNATETLEFLLSAERDEDAAADAGEAAPPT